MKHLKFVVLFLAVLAMLIGPAQNVQAAGPTGNWATGIACQNLDNSDATGNDVTLTFYPEMNGTPIATTYSTTIAMGGSANWLTTSGSSMPGFPTGFLGSGIISAEYELSCNVNTQSTGTGTQANPYRLGTSGAFTSSMAGPNVYVPQVIKNLAGWNSYVAVQNTSASPVAAHIRYYNASTGAEIAAAAEAVTIPGGASKVFYQSDNANLPAGYNAGAKISADDGTSLLVATVAIYRDATDYTRSQFLSYNGVASGSSSVYVPRFVRNLAGYNSGIAIQNVGTADTVATVVFTFEGNAYTLTTPAIHPNTSYTAAAASIAALAPVDALANHQGSAVVTVPAPGQIIVSINEDNQSGAPTRLGQGTTYNAPAAGTETTKIFFAQFVKNLTAGNVYNSGIQISNTTAIAGTCNVEYVGQPSANATLALPASGSLVLYAPNITLLNNGYNAGVRVTCTQKVTGIVNLSISGYGDSFTQTTGLNQ